MKVDKSKFVLGRDGSLKGVVAWRIRLAQDIADLLRETSNSASHYIGLLARATIPCMHLNGYLFGHELIFTLPYTLVMGTMLQTQCKIQLKSHRDLDKSMKFEFEFNYPFLDLTLNRN